MNLAARAPRDRKRHMTDKDEHENDLKRTSVFPKYDPVTWDKPS